MKTGLESLDTGASKITYSGNEGPKAPMQMAMADPLLVEEYQKYVFEMEEQGLQPMSFEEFRRQAMSGMAEGGIANTKTIKGQPHMLAYITPNEAGTLKDLGGQETMTPEGIPAYPPPGEYGGPGYAGSRSPDTGRERGIREAAQSYSAPSPSPSGNGRQDREGEGYYDSPEGKKQLADQRARINEMREKGEGIFADETKDTKPVSNFFDARKKAAYNASLIIPGQTERITKYRKAYKEYLKSMGITPPTSLDDEDLYEFFKSDAFNYEPGAADAGMPEAMNYGDFLLERFNNPTVKYRGDMGAYKREMGLGGDGPGITSQYPYPYPINTAVAPAVVAPETAVATATGNPFLPGSNLPFSTYGTAAHGAQFGVDQRMFAADGGRIGYAGGGIADLRQGYFLGKLVKKATRGIKKIIKSPVGKLALIGGLAGAGGFGPFKGLKPFLFGSPKSMIAGPIKGLLGSGSSGTTGFLSKALNYLKTGKGAMTGIAALSTLPLLFGQSQEEEEGMKYADLPNIFDKYSPDQLRQMALAGELPQNEYPFQSYYLADGGRVGLMNGGNPRFAALNKLYNINDEEEFSQGGSAGLPPITQGVEGQNLQSFSDDETPTPTQPDQMPRPMPRPMMAGRMSPMMMAGRMNPMMARGMMPRMMAQEGGLMDQENMLMAGGGLRGEKAQQIAEMMAEEQYGMEFYDLPLKTQMEIYEIALDMYDNRGMASGGRVAAQEGGLMDMGGMEKDYRNEGGFVPIGGQERADDVPARLSKNEFVFTADAVRNAGDGDIDKGAEVMENMMENLEKGGKVSEESQGLKGARDMFATAQRLEGVL
jgi:hypothetical protein